MSSRRISKTNVSPVLGSLSMIDEQAVKRSIDDVNNRLKKFRIEGGSKDKRNVNRHYTDNHRHKSKDTYACSECNDTEKCILQNQPKSLVRPRKPWNEQETYLFPDWDQNDNREKWLKTNEEKLIFSEYILIAFYTLPCVDPTVLTQVSP